jgi:hypothetical protein
MGIKENTTVSPRMRLKLRGIIVSRCYRAIASMDALPGHGRLF